MALRIYVCADVKRVCDWQCISSLDCNGNSLIQVDCLFSVSNLHRRTISSINSVACLSHVSAVSLAIGTNMCVASSSWNFMHSSPLHVSLLCRLYVPWIEDETLHMCPKSWRPMPELCLSSRELMWLHPDLAVLHDECSRCFMCRDLVMLDRSPYDVINHRMALVAWCRSSAW